MTTTRKTRKLGDVPKVINKSIHLHHEAKQLTLPEIIDFQWTEKEGAGAYHCWNGERHFIRISVNIETELNIREDAKNLPLLYKRVYEHERMHAKYSTKEKAWLWAELKRVGISHRLWNVGEDVRIEGLAKSDKEVSSWGWTKWINVNTPWIGSKPIDAVNILLSMKMIGTGRGGKEFKAYMIKAREDIRTGSLTSVNWAEVSYIYWKYRQLQRSTVEEVIKIMAEFARKFSISEAGEGLPGGDVEFTPKDMDGTSGGGTGAGSGSSSGSGGSSATPASAPESGGESEIPIVDPKLMMDDYFQELDMSEFPPGSPNREQHERLFSPWPANQWQPGWGDEIVSGLRNVFRSKGREATMPTMDMSDDFDMLDAMNKRPEAFREETDGDFNPRITVILDCSGSMRSRYYDHLGASVMGEEGNYLTHKDEMLRIVDALNTLHIAKECRFDLLLSGQGRGIHWRGGFAGQFLQHLLFSAGYESIQATMRYYQDLLIASDIVIVLTDGQITDEPVDKPLFEAMGINAIGAYCCDVTGKAKYDSCTRKLSSWFSQSIVRSSAEELIVDMADGNL